MSNLKKLLAKVSFVNVRNWVNLLIQRPLLNQQITKQYSNTMSMTGSGDLTLATPSTPIPTSAAIGSASLNGYKPVEGIQFANVQKIGYDGYDIVVEQDRRYHN